ncbi:sensor histidine kinase [Streptococcus catagoni]|uniref:sensor histidine kinase n=1 Tax=Streptococcus catagoni TaxID=2654874 RepID=UPI001F24A1D8|nr:histidine kinase [Streptococcus catagoni]
MIYRTFLKNAMHDVRQMVTTLKDHRIDHELLVITNMLDAAGVNFEVKGENLANQLTADLQNRMSMILRELSNNLLKHSQAKNCQLVFKVDGGQFQLTYQDDGRGFSGLSEQELHSIKERLVPIQASLTISSLHQPTQIDITIPLKESKK